MKSWMIILGICLDLFVVGCSRSDIQPSATSTVEATPTKKPEPQIIVPDLNSLPEGAGWSGSTQSATLVDKDGAPAIEFDEPDWNLVWLDDFDFTEGTIEFDAKGKSEPPQGSFIGVMFRVVDEATYDAVYFRPFNFNAPDDTRKSHAVQYVSSPEWSWERLRSEKTGQYEKAIEPPPDGDLWFHAKIVIDGREIRVFVNDAEMPALQVTELSDRSDGSVGIWCYGYGVISNLQITPAR
jgi:hypothetical protein